MRKIYIILGLISLFIAPTLVQAQYCHDFHKKYCKPANDGAPFEYDGQSRSALFESGQTSDLKIIAYKGQDYRITICSDKTMGTVHIRIMDEKNVKVQKTDTSTVMEDIMMKCPQCGGTGQFEGDVCGNCGGSGKVPSGKQKPVKKTETKMVMEKQKELLYDNAQKKYVNHVEFSMTTTKRLILEITTGASAGGGGNGESSGGKKSLGGGEMGCVGILIQHMATPKKGF